MKVLIAKMSNVIGRNELTGEWNRLLTLSSGFWKNKLATALYFP
jgi:hypothetical protein